MNADDHVEILRGELAASAEVLIEAASRGLDSLRAARSGDQQAWADVEEQLCRIVSACGFDDLADQRLTQLSARIGGRQAFGEDPLLNGPAAPGEGVAQSEIDRLFQGEDGPC